MTPDEIERDKRTWFEAHKLAQLETRQAWAERLKEIEEANGQDYRKLVASRAKTIWERKQ